MGMQSSWRLLLSVYLAGALMQGSNVALAQDTGGGLEGHVLDGDGASVAFVNIMVRGPSLQGTRETFTLENGTFRVFSLPPGTYQVEFEHVGYHGLGVQDVRIFLGKVTSLGDISLVARIYDMEEVVVRAPALATDLIHTSIASNITSEELERLPVGRDVEDALVMVPHANESYYNMADRVNIAGSTGPDATYFLDGNNITQPAVGGIRMDVPWNFLEEIQVVEGGYQAEFGRSVGGIVNLVSLRPTDEIAGNAFAFTTGDWLTSQPKQGVGEATGDDVLAYDFGFGVGGPIAKDKLSFFAAYDQERTREDADFYGLGTERLEARYHRYLGTLTWSATEETEARFNVFGNVYRGEYIWGRGFGPPTSVEDLDCLLQKAEQEPVSLSLGLSHRFLEGSQLEATAAQYHHGVSAGGATPRGASEPLVFNYDTGEYSGGHGILWDATDVRTSWRLHGQTFWRQHALKAGVEYDRVSSKQILDYSTILVSRGLYQWTRSGYPADDRAQYATAFLQDSWQVDERLRLNLGARWEGQYLGSADDVVVSISDEWQPRLGFVYRPNASSRGRIFGSYGRYYAPLVSTAIGALVDEQPQITEYYSQDPRLPGATPDSTVVGGEGLEPIIEESPRGEHYDEWTLGVDWLLGTANRVAVKGMYRELRTTLRYVTDLETRQAYFGNPGDGALATLPHYRRDYAGLELSFERSFGQSTKGALCYVLSRSRGNYPGMYDPYYNAIRGGSATLAHPGLASIGPLPNDRQHVIKFRMSHLTGFGLAGGVFLTWQSGTPFNEIIDYSYDAEFLGGRGGAGRLPAIWDLSLRASFQAGLPVRGLQSGRVILDVLHVGNPRQVVKRDEIRARDYSWADYQENPSYGRAVAYQPPMMVRLGWEVTF